MGLSIQGAGVTMAFGGAMLIAVLDGFDFSQRNPWGTVALLAATFSYALYMVIILCDVFQPLLRRSTSSFLEPWLKGI